MAAKNSKQSTTTKTSNQRSRREQGVAERKSRLVKAAGILIEKSSDGTFSMPELAKQAELSLATPYNLFGSKAAVLSALFDSQVQDFYQDKAWMNDLPPSDLVFGIIDKLVAAYSRKPMFYKNLRKSWYALGAHEHAKYSKPEHGHLVQPLIYTLARDGHISQKISLAVLEVTLMRIFSSAVEEWALQDWSMVQLKTELYASFALVFRGVLPPAETEKLDDAIAAASSSSTE